MKFLTIAVLFSVCTSVFAQDGEMFAKAKEHALSNIDKRIGHLNEMKSCVGSATNKDGIKSCRDAHKAQIKSLKDGNEGWREGMKTERKTKREERKKQ